MTVEVDDRSMPMIVKVTKRRWLAWHVLVVLAVVSSGCATEESNGRSIPTSKTTTQGERGPKGIACHVFYRRNVSASLGSERRIVLQRDGDRNRLDYKEVTFIASYSAPSNEVPSLLLVTKGRDGRELSRDLYQLSPEGPYSNLFNGDSTFTSLSYVYPPTSKAELQYFCDFR
jgi:hypothetical protein